MTYYLIIYYDEGMPSPEYFWTKNRVVLDLFFKEYSNIQPHCKLIEYDDCKDNRDFYDQAIYDTHGELSDYNELYMINSEHDPEVYHVTTPKIDDDNANGMTDENWRSIKYGIVKSAMNLSLLTPYIKDPKYSTMLQMTMMKFVVQFILLDEGVICDYYDEGGVNRKWLDVMGIDETETMYNEGIFSLVDYAMFTKMCDGMEL